MRAGRLACALLAATVGCAQPDAPRSEGSSAEGEQARDPLAARQAELEAQAARNTLDPWPHYHLARLFEEQGELPRAIQEYGAAINRLPPRSYTTPMLRLGALHQRLGNADAAARCFAEVLDTVTGDSTKYRANPDFRLAARGLKAALEARTPVPAERLAELRARFLGELGGTDEQWATPPPWLPKDEEEPRAEGAPTEGT